MLTDGRFDLLARGLVDDSIRQLSDYFVETVQRRELLVPVDEFLFVATRLYAISAFVANNLSN